MAQRERPHRGTETILWRTRRPTRYSGRRHVNHLQSVARVERVLAVGRAFLTVTALVAIYLDPTEPTRLATITYTVLLGYAIYSVAVLVVVRWAPPLAPWHGHGLHAIDVLWTSALTFVSEGPVSPFFLFFLFVVLAAAYRWGFRGTMTTAGVTIAVFLLETAVAASGPWKQTWFAAINFELNRTILRVTYLLLTGVLLGYLAEDDKQTRAELAALASAARQLRVDLGPSASVHAIAEGLMRTFQATAASVVVHEVDSGARALWRLRTAGPGGLPEPLHVDLDPSQQASWFFKDAGQVWHAAPTSHSGTYRAWTAASDTWSLLESEMSVPDEVFGGHEGQTITAANLGLAHEWRGRIYLFGAARMGPSARALQFFEALTEHVGPALTNVFLLRRLRSQASAAERAHVARELHDGAVQALFGLEMKARAMQRHPDRASADYERQLDELQATLHREALGLRELMHALRPIRLDAGEPLAEVLASVVERFRRDTGLPARFVSDGTPIALPPDTALEVVRIVQEALVNVRKHSRACNVLVRLARDRHACTLVVEDDGSGFDFDGRLTLDELDRCRTGPVVIKERARIAGVALAIDSTPGRGARIELTLPEAAGV